MIDNKSTDADELWAVFGEESHQNLDQAETCLLKLETTPADQNEISALFRSIHTLKGSARMMGLGVMETLAHKAEDLISLLRDNKISIDGNGIDLLLKVTDCLRRMLVQSLASHSDPSPCETGPLFDRLTLLITTGHAGEERPGLQPPIPEAVKTPPQPGNDIEKSEETTLPIQPVEKKPDPDLVAGGSAVENSDLVDFSADPASVRIFFEMADEEKRWLVRSVCDAASGNPEATARILSSADSLQYAAGQMGYQFLQSILLELMNAIRGDRDAGREIYQTQISAFSVELDRLRATYPYLPAESQPRDPVEFDQNPSDRRAVEKDNLSGKIVSPEIISQQKHLDIDTSGVLKEMQDALAEIIGEQSILHRMIMHMEHTDLVGMLSGLSKKYPGDTARIKAEFEVTLTQWLDQISAISQAEKKIGASLSQIHETVRLLCLTPASTVLEPLRIWADDWCQSHARSVEFLLVGGEIELEQSILKSLEDCLRPVVEMMLSDSIETTQERVQTGKAQQARLQLSVVNQGHHLSVTLEDDGRGAPERGNTLDDVRSHLEQKHGFFNDQSGPHGSRFILNLPLNQSIIDGMVVRIGKVFYLVSIDSIRRILRKEHSNLTHSSADDNQTMLRLDEDLVPVYTFPGTDQYSNEPLLIVIEGATRQYALMVNEIIGQQRATVLPLPLNMAGVQNAFGCVILGEGEIGLVLDINRVCLN